MSLRSLSLPFSFSHPPVASSRPSPPPFARQPILSFPSSVPIPLNTSSRSPFRAAWRRPVYVYPDPIPEFAKAETRKFEDDLRRKLLKSKEIFGDDVDTVVELCGEIFSNFLHKEYGGPGTLLVEPFTEMLLALKEKKLPGAPVAARAALLWAQNYVNQDWETWTFQQSQ
ncbi:protein PLASTID REDOX INSENSITIVE 2, chloroplastic-like [Musa acuminata AAA Group]|uniref:protein PLASTID REDOX INSENSITIVE 2, chloroplastic-like n=1 Tax=Musa acuminata AAA Group TaxID=214697 RepID=UPI0031DFFFAB